MIGRKSENNILVSNSVCTRPVQENSKKISKKIEKIIKPLTSNIFSQNGMRSNEKKKIKILVLNSVHTRHRQENSEKNIKKLQKITKPLTDITPEFRSYTTRARKFRKK